MMRGKRVLRFYRLVALITKIRLRLPEKARLQPAGFFGRQDRHEDLRLVRKLASGLAVLIPVKWGAWQA